MTRASGGKPRAITNGESEDESPTFSPDGRWLAFVSNRENLEERHIWLVSVDGGKPRRLNQIIEQFEQGKPAVANEHWVFFTLTSSPFLIDDLKKLRFPRKKKKSRRKWVLLALATVGAAVAYAYWTKRAKA